MGYRIDIDHGGCITCGICMDVCPVEALDMSRPDAPGVETGPGPGHPLAWMMEHPLQVGECIGCGICIRECPPNVMSLVTMSGEVPLAARQGPIDRPPEAPADGWVPLSQVTREALKPVHDSPWGDLFTWRTRSRPKEWQVWTSMVDDAPPSPLAPCQEACPAGTDAGRYVGLIGAGRYDEAYAVAAEVNPFPSVCGWICTAPCEVACRRGVLDEPIAIRTLKRFAAEHGTLPAVEPPTVRRPERVAIVGGGPAGMSAAWYLARLGYPVTVLEAMPVPGGMMAIGIPEYRLPREVLPGGDRADPRGRGRAAAGHGDGPRLRPGRPRARGVQGDLPRDRRVQEPPPRGPGRRAARGHPGDEVPQGGQPRRVAPPVGRRRRRRRRQHRDGRGAVGAPQRRGHRDHHLSPGPPRHARPGRGDRGGRARGHRGPRRPRAGRGRRPQRGRRGRSLRRHATRLPTIRRLAAPAWAPTARDPRAPGERDPRRHRRGARPVDPARGRRHRGQRLGRDRGRSPDARHGPGRDLRRRRRRVGTASTIIEAVAAGRRAAASIHEYLAGVPDGEAEILAAVRYRTAPESSLTRRPRGASAGPRGVAGRGHRVVLGRRRPASPTRRRMRRPAGASAATRSTAARPSTSWPVAARPTARAARP